MWMMMGFDGGQDSLSARRLRPLMPRPSSRTHDFVALNHHLAIVEQNKRELVNTQQVVVSSRWNPTPEQLQTLEELYRRGTRTPSAEQIQHITARLRQYGKIEGKNVFYWFQNHKARERLKRRRHLDEQQQIPPQSSEKGEPTTGSNGEDVGEVEQQTKNWASPTNSEKGASQRGPKKTDDGWLHFNDNNDDEPELLHRNATWQSTMHLTSSSSLSSPTSFINPSCSSTTSAPTMNHIPESLLAIFSGNAGGETGRTLELFPLSTTRSGGRSETEEVLGECGEVTRGTSYQFFEFLPLKN